MKRLGVGILALVAAALAAYALVREPPPPPTPPPVVTREPLAPTATAPVVVPTPAPAPLPTDEPDLDGSLDRFLGAVPVTAPPPGPGPRELVTREKDAGGQPANLRTPLEDALRDPRLRAEAADLLAAAPSHDDPWTFVLALALAARLDGPTTDRLLASLRTASPGGRAQVLMALRGSAEPRVDAAFIDHYLEEEAPDVRDRAAFILGERGERVDPAVRARALVRARVDLRGPDDAAASAAADVLGAPPLDPTDRGWLEAQATSDPSPLRRQLALRALAGAGVSAAELGPALESLMRDAPR